MPRRIVTGTAVVALSVSALMADFSYQEKATVTGGALASAMKVAGVFSKQAREPIVTTVSVKGDKMAQATANRIFVIDLSTQTVTTIDTQKKTYSVTTFEEMKQMMEQAAQKMKQSDANVNFKVSTQATGNTKPIAGFDTRELLVKMQMEATDQSSSQSGAMTIDVDVWIARSVPGYGEVRDFERRMAAQLDWSPGFQMAMGQAQAAKGLAEAYKELGKLDGIPVFQTVTVNAQGQPGGASQAQPQQQQQHSAMPSLGGALGGRLGLGRKKQQDDSASSSSGSGNSQAAGSLIEMTRELSGFSSGSLDDAQFSVPAGFKKVEPDQRRGGH